MGYQPSSVVSLLMKSFQRGKVMVPSTHICCRRPACSFGDPSRNMLTRLNTISQFQVCCPNNGVSAFKHAQCWPQKFMNWSSASSIVFRNAGDNMWWHLLKNAISLASYDINTTLQQDKEWPYQLPKYCVDQKSSHSLYWKSARSRNSMS